MYLVFFPLWTWSIAEEKCVEGAKVFSSKRAVPVTDLAAFADHVQSEFGDATKVEKKCW